MIQSSGKILIDGNALSLSDVQAVSVYGAEAALAPQAKEKVLASRSLVDKVLASGEAVYGITTGFGKFKDVYIQPEDGRQLQRNIVRSHAAGIGPNFDQATTRAIMLLRANALAKGFSGVRLEVIDMLLDCLNQGVHPLIPEQGSLGASGDLAPLAHLALVLIGEGQARFEGSVMPGADALRRAKLRPLELEAKEGLALLNGTQMMSAVGTLTLLEAEQLAMAADIIGAMSLDAQLGTSKAFCEEVQAVRPHPGQIAAAANLRKLLAGSQLMMSHAECGMVQDAYSLRCMPQVHGASRQAFKHVREVLEIEINSATDNPLVFADGIISGGNFHGQPLALAFDYMSCAICELANISERRIERLVNPHLSNGLPPFLIEDGGLNSGLMMAQYTAAALVSENKSLAHPASVDSIPTSANQEDHVSMGSISGRKARMILNNARRVLGIELMVAAQALDFRMCGSMHMGACTANGAYQMITSPPLMAAHALVRRHIPYVNEDRILQADMSICEELISDGSLVCAVEAIVDDLY